MKQLKVSTTGQVSLFVEQYNIWRDCKNFYQHQDVTPVFVHDDNGIPCFHHTQIAEINSCSSEVICIDNFTEGINSKPNFIRYRSDRRYIIFSDGSWDKQNLDLGYDYEIVEYFWLLFDMADTFNTPNRFSFYIDKIYKFDYPKPYVFCSTTGNVRPHRTKFIKELTNTIDFNNYILRYSGQDLGVTNHNLDLLDIAPGQFDPYTPIVEKYYHSVSQTFPIDIYNSSYFNVIVETNLNYNDTFFITEKTIKSLISGQPFVSVASAGFLKHIRELGFETYSKLWDESYDDELDFDKRIKKIAKLVNDLNNFDWESNREQLEIISLKNRANFLNLDKLSDKQFTDLEKVINNIYLQQ